MHAFVDDHLIVFDAFGLTRIGLSPSGEVKHNKKVVGEFMVQNGRLLVAHSHVSNNRFAMTVPDLKVVPIDDKWNYNLTYGTSIGVTPDGLPFEVSGQTLVVYGLDGAEGARVKAASVGKPSAEIDLGPALPVAATQWAPTVAMGTDGTFVVVGDGALFGGKLDGSAITQAWSVPVRRTQGQLRARAGAFGAFVSAFHPAQGSAYCVRVRLGKLVKTEVVECIAPVDFDGTRIVYQVSTSEVRRKPFGEDSIERFGLPQPERGTVMADGDRLWFVTADHERVRDLVNDDVIERGLPEGERANRTKVLAFVEGFREVANAANLDVRVSALRPPAYGQGPRPDWGWNEGDQSLLRTCVIGNLLARSYDDRDLSAGSYSPPTHLAPVTEADVERMFEALDARGLDLVAGVAMLETALAYHWGPRYGHAKTPVFAKAAGRRLLAAIVETVATGKQGKLAATPVPHALDAAMLIDRFDPTTAQWATGTYAHAQKATLYILIDTLEAAALPVILDWLLERPSGMVQANMHVVGKAAAAMIVAFPTTKAEFERRVAEAIAGADEEKAQRATSLQQAVAFEIR